MHKGHDSIEIDKHTGLVNIETDAPILQDSESD